MSSPSSQTTSVIVNGVPIVWKEHGQGFTFFGIDSIIFWKNPSLASILMPLRNEVGDELFSLLIAHEASKGTFEDYHSMVNTLGEGFEEGFLNWGKAVGGAGWGAFSIISLDWEKKEAVLQITDPWEAKVFRAEHPQDIAPFLSGKISGIFSHAFKTNCRSEVVQTCVGQDEVTRVTLRVRPSTETLEQALLAIQERRKLSPQTEVRAVNSALRRNQQRLLDILDTVGEFIWETDANLNISYATNQTSSVLEIPLDELLGKSLFSLIHSADVSYLQELLTTLKLGKQPYREVNLRLAARHGKNIWVCFKIKALYDFSGNHSGYLGSGKDISAQVQLEEELEEQRHKSAQSARMASLGEMAGGIAHELNNPLSVIIASSWELKNSIDPKNDEHAKWAQTLTLIDETAQRMAKIIKGMRSFSRDAESDPFVVSSLESILDETLLFCRERFANHQIALMEPETYPNLTIECRPTEISQILLNLLNNSFDAVFSLGEKWVELRVDELPEEIRIQVTDSGNGISKGIREKLMQPFFTTKEPGKGTGLGLSISNRIALKHHGKIYLDERCKNTCFVLVLPKRQPPSRESTTSGQ
jgi:PAS domain S-box-containing protein